MSKLMKMMVIRMIPQYFVCDDPLYLSKLPDFQISSFQIFNCLYTTDQLSTVRLTGVSLPQRIDSSLITYPLLASGSSPEPPHHG